MKFHCKTKRQKLTEEMMKFRTNGLSSWKKMKHIYKEVNNCIR